MHVAAEGSPSPHAWQSPTAPRSCRPASGSREPVACRGRLPAQSCLSGLVSEYCSEPSTSRRGAGGPTGMASCQASSCQPLRGLGLAAGFVVEALREARAIVPSTTVLPAGGRAKQSVGACLAGGWRSAHGGRPRHPLVDSRARWGQRIDLAQWCRAWPGGMWVRRRRPGRCVSCRLSRSQASRISAWTPEASIRVRACSCNRAMCALSGGTAASLSSCRRLVALNPPVTVRRQRCCCRSRASPIHRRWAGRGRSV